MSRKPSFEEALKQKLTELPLPDENASWQKMNAMLDEKEKRRLFFVFTNGKALGGALLLCALLAGWFLFSLQTKTASGKLAADTKKATATTVQNADSGETNTGNRQESYSRQESAASIHHDTISASSITSVPSSTSSVTGNDSLSGKNKKTPVKHNGTEAEKESFTHQVTSEDIHKNTPQQTGDFALQTKSDTAIKSTTIQQNKQALITGNSLQTPGTIISPDTLASIVTDSTQSITAIKSNLPKTDSTSTSTTVKTSIKIKPRSNWFIDAGIGMKQQLPIDSQRFASRNYNGTKSWFSDYIPFLYARLEKENKWFVQGEFHYAAPRLIKSITYWQKTKVDYSHSIASRDMYRLQKTWYHQVPLSLNVYVRPSWSVGAGAMYSIFYGAAANRAISTYDATSGQYSSSRIQLHWRGYTDSFLYKTNTSLLLQTNYQLSRWLFGICYLHDLHPFVTYTLPDGTRRDVRNTSLEMMIRYRFYRSHKFRIGKL